MRTNAWKAPITSFDFLWLSPAISLVLLIAFLLPLQPQDYWWYLRLGRDTLAMDAFPRVDTLSFTRAGHPLIYQLWLSALLLWNAIIFTRLGSGQTCP